MFDFSQYSFSSQVLAFVGLFLGLASLLVLLNCLWRSHKMLATSIKLCIVSIGLFCLRKIIGIFDTTGSAQWVSMTRIFDIGQSLFFLLAVIEFYKIIRILDGETITTSGLKPAKKK